MFNNTTMQKLCCSNVFTTSISCGWSILCLLHVVGTGIIPYSFLIYVQIALIVGILLIVYNLENWFCKVYMSSDSAIHEARQLSNRLADCHSELNRVNKELQLLKQENIDNAEEKLLKTKLLLDRIRSDINSVIANHEDDLYIR